MVYTNVQNFAFSLFFVCISFVFCSKKQFICPAYTTYFIHDEKERNKVFMPFLEDSLAESSASVETADSTSNKTQKTGVSSKFQLNTVNSKEKTSKKYQVNGLITSTKSGKSKARNVAEIEMKVISIKGTALYSGVDSTSTNTNIDTPNKEVSPADTLDKK